MAEDIVRAEKHGEGNRLLYRPINSRRRHRDLLRCARRRERVLGLAGGWRGVSVTAEDGHSARAVLRRHGITDPQDQPGSHTEPTQALPGVGVFVDVGNFGGRCPFPFTRFSIWVNANVDLRFVDDVGAVQVVILNLAPNDRLLKESLMPKRWRVQIAPTVINQTAFVTWSR